MRKLTNNELTSITGGFDWTGAAINSLARGIKILLDLGRSLGTAIRRVTSNSICPVS